MMKFICGIFLGIICAGSLVDAGSNPCGKIYGQLKSQAQIENLRFKQRLFIERFAKGKR